MGNCLGCKKQRPEFNVQVVRGSEVHHIHGGPTQAARYVQRLPEHKPQPQPQPAQGGGVGDFLYDGLNLVKGAAVGVGRIGAAAANQIVEKWNEQGQGNGNKKGPNRNARRFK